MRAYTVHLFRSGRVWVQQGCLEVSHDVDPPLVSKVVHNVRSELEAVGHVLLDYVDRANQTYQHVCAPCDQPCCNTDCVCGQPLEAHWSGMSQPHPFTPRSEVP